MLVEVACCSFLHSVESGGLAGDVSVELDCKIANEDPLALPFIILQGG